MRTRLAAAAAVAALVVIVSAGCTGQTWLQDSAAAACENRVGPAIVSWWRDQYSETPWKVDGTRSTGVERDVASSSAASVFTVSGASSVQREESGGTVDRVRWSCSARITTDDPSTVSATIEEISFR